MLTTNDDGSGEPPVRTGTARGARTASQRDRIQLTEMQEINSRESARITRLDSIRFLAACWVAISHGATPIKSLSENGLTHFGLAAVQDSFDGVAAVIVFFIVSGLCIHLPYCGREEIHLSSFLIRRFVRVGIPLVLISYISRVIGGSAEMDLATVNWSIYAELFYYSMYPSLLIVARRRGWEPLIAVSCIFTLVISLAFASKTHISHFGWPVSFWGLPIWMSGCLLAERLSSRTHPEIRCSIWLWRLAAWLVSVAAVWFVFHSPIRIGYGFSMLLFAAIAFFWLQKELWPGAQALPLLEHAGAASYSLYLVHPVVLGALQDLGARNVGIEAIALRVGLIAIMTALFYLIVEAPAHKFARYLSQAAAGIVAESAGSR